MINLFHIGHSYSQAELIKKLSQNMPARNFFSLTSQIEEMALQEDTSASGRELDIIA